MTTLYDEALRDTQDGKLYEALGKFEEIQLIKKSYRDVESRIIMIRQQIIPRESIWKRTFHNILLGILLPGVFIFSSILIREIVGDFFSQDGMFTPDDSFDSFLIAVGGGLASVGLVMWLLLRRRYRQTGHWW